MAGFGKRPWGSSPFGSLLSGITGVPETKTPTDSVTQGTAGGTGTSGAEAVLSLTDFENAVFTGDPGTTVNPQHVAAYVKSFGPVFGTSVSYASVLKAKSWTNVASYVAYDPGTITAPPVDLPVIIKAAGQGLKDLSAHVFAFGGANTGDPVDLPASLQPHYLEDMPAIMAVIDAVNLPTSLITIPGVNLPTRADPIPGVNLGATGGGHFPEDFPASAGAVPPVDLPVYIRGGFSDVANLLASVVQVGGFSDLGVILSIALPDIKNLEAKIGVIGQGTKELPAQLQPIHESDLPATIITQRIREMRAIITGFAPGTSDLSASLARISSASIDMQAHTIAQFIDLVDLAGKVRIVQLGGNDVPSSLTAVAPFYNINKVPLQLVPLTNLDAVLTQHGGFLPMSAIITPVHSVSTGTAADSGFVVTASSYRFYLGTTGGLFIPPQIIPQVRVSTYTNNTNHPDLHATIAAWNQTSLSASISTYPSKDLSGTMGALGFDRIADFPALISGNNVRNLQASLTTVGGFIGLSATVTTLGHVGNLGGTIIPFIDPLALSIVSVSTQPIFDLGAIINYDSFVRCAPTSFISHVSAYIKPLVTGTPNNQLDMSAEILSRLAALDMSATIEGKKITRIRILNLTFTAKIRESALMRGNVTPLHHVYSDMATSITGLLHEVDLPATLAVVRYAPSDINFTAVEVVGNLITAEIKDVLISFRSQVTHYVYEDITNAVYATDRGTWAIDVRTLATTDNFFDRALNNREYTLEGLQEFYSLDEAIRSAVVILCERRQVGLGATLTVRGAAADVGAQVGAFSLERVVDIPTKIMPVAHLPDITATINAGIQSSAFTTMAAVVVPNNTEVLENLPGDIFGDIPFNLGAEITAL